MNINTFLEERKIKLNKQQKEAVENINGKVLLLAVPGSGKTTVIVTRIGYMVHTKNIPPQNILTLTYSVSAAKDMKERYEKFFGEEKLLNFRTIHSFCVMVLKEFEQETGRKIFSLIRNVNEVLASLYLQIKREIVNDAILKEITTQITYCKNSMLTDEEIKKVKNDNINLYEIYKAYENYKIQNKLMDFDDQLKYVYEILKTYPKLLERLKKRYTYINIDEAQDTSKIQHEIIKLLVDKNLFMVGDEDQSIYRFRAAYPQALLDFKKTYKGAKVLLMETNYRSTPQILNIANKFIKQNKNRKDKNIIPYRKDGEKTKQIICQNIEEQYNYILNEAKKAKEQIAILYRNNDSAIPIVNLFNKNNIEFTIRESDATFFSHYIVKDITYFIKFYLEPKNIENFKKIYYKIGCGISKTIMNKLQIETAKRPNQNIIDNLIYLKEVVYWQKKKIRTIKREMLNWSRKTPYEIIQSIIKDLEYEKYLKKKKIDKSSILQKINVILSLAKQEPNINVFLKTLEELEMQIKEGSNYNSNVILSTIHGSKGLEYDKVIIIDVNKGILPSVEKTKNEKSEEYEQYEEEIRLFYVAMTRAKNKLEILTYQNAYGEDIKSSQFIEDVFGSVENSQQK